MVGIYKIVNLLDAKLYVGMSVDVESRIRRHRQELDKNKHPSIHLQNAWNKYGAENFEFGIIEECSNEVLAGREKYWVSFLKVEDRRFGYNQKPGGLGGSVKGARRTAQTKLNMSIAQRKVGTTSARLMAVRAAGLRRRGVPISDGLRAILLEANTGRPCLPETRSKISIAQKGIPKSEEAKQNMKDAAVGRVLSEQHKKNIGNGHRGKKRSPEARANMSAAQRRKAAERKKDKP